MTPSPTEFRSKFLRTVSERGFIHQCTDFAALDALLADGEAKGKPVTCYIGFDCTAPSLHVGSLIQIMMLRHWQQAGHKPIVLMGGGTTKIGDPSGKDESRQMLTEEKIAENMAGIKKVFEHFLTFGDGPTDAMMVDNADWLERLGYLDFLREYGRLFSVNRMLTMESVKRRLQRDGHLSFLEFNYMILQAYDFLKLWDQYNCRLQIGGSDQWGNIVYGVELARKCNAPVLIYKNHDERTETLERLEEGLSSDLFGLTTPLLTTASGSKMGKTASGAVWLDSEMLLPSDYWQFWRNVEDADTARFLRFFTPLSMSEIEFACGANINEAKKRLATEATALLHGREAAEKAAEAARLTFEQGSIDSLPEHSVAVEGEIAAFQLFVATGLAASGGEARRLIQGGGARLNDAPIDNPTRAYSRNELVAMQPIKLSAGKKKHIRVVIA